MVVLLLMACNAYAANYTGRTIKAKMASEEIEGDFMTVWARNFIGLWQFLSRMKIRTQQYWKVKIIRLCSMSLN